MNCRSGDMFGDMCRCDGLTLWRSSRKSKWLLCSLIHFCYSSLIVAMISTSFSHFFFPFLSFCLFIYLSGINVIGFMYHV